jgi:subtilase-type serine protease
MNIGNRGSFRALLLSTAIAGILANTANAQTASDPANPETWRNPEYRAQWGLDFINAADAYAKGVDGSGVMVGVIDSGMDIDHPEFAGRYIEGVTYDPSRPWDADTDGHGTAVASIIAANRDGVGMQGVAPGATIVMANDGGNPGFTDQLGALYGISQLVDRGVRIFNNSYGFFRPITDVTLEEAESTFELDLPVYRRAIAAGSLLIWSTGNVGRSQPSLNAGLPFYFPELESGWLAVTAVGPRKMPDWANGCGVAMNWCLAAPGGSDDWEWDESSGQWVWVGDRDDILIANPGGGYSRAWGTSLAAPHVAGTAALVSQMFPYMTMEQVRQVLLGTARDVGAPGVDDVYGYGLLDAGKAVLGPGKFDWGDFHAVLPGGVSTWENDITGDGGLIKSGDGVLILTGDSTYLGDTRIAGGVLAVGGSIASQTFVGFDGMLSGNGTIFGDVDNKGAVFAGWSSDGGTLTIDGDYRQRKDSWLFVEVGAPDGTSHLDVSGEALLEGGTVGVGLAPGGYRGDARHTILSAGGGITGRFDEICNCFAFLDFALSYDPGKIYLDVARNAVAFADVGTTRNQRAVGAGIESLGGLIRASAASGSGNALYDLIIGLDEETARAAFDSFSGELHPSVTSALVDESRFARDAISNRLSAVFGTVNAPSMPAWAYGPAGAIPAAADMSTAVWGQAYGAWGRISQSGNAAGLDRSAGGVFVGVDGDIGNAWRAGLMGGYGSSSFHVDARASSASVDSYTLAAYAGTRSGSAAFRFGAAHSWHDIDANRSLPFLGEIAESDYGARTAQIFGEASYRVDSNRIAFEPFANLAYVRSHTDSFEESGTAGLIARSANQDAVLTTIGLRAETVVAEIASAAITARGMVGWQHAFGDVSPETTFAFAGGTPFNVEGAPLARDALVLDAGLSIAATANFNASLSYTGQIAKGSVNQGVRGDLTWKF